MRKNTTALSITTSVSLIALTANAANFLEQEAGMTVYMSAGRSINLDQVKPIYRTVEHEDDNYVIGSVQIGSYAETEDVHVYVDESGWIAAYYLADEPTAKIIDWYSYTGGEITGTKLELALIKITNIISVPMVEVKYFNFTTPQADSLLIVIDKESGDKITDTFDILIPYEITIYERAWSLFTSRTDTSSLSIDGNNISSFVAPATTAFAHGKLTPNQLSQGVSHTVRVYNDDNYDDGWTAGAIVLAYKQP